MGSIPDSWDLNPRLRRDTSRPHFEKLLSYTSEEVEGLEKSLPIMGSLVNEDDLVAQSRTKERQETEDEDEGGLHLE